ncbi:shikimate dehydrogenase [Piscibacillus halophilus]|uniref:Shikimate dehydrogenase (NADP(+)) n=1 Tax=Piscibacillus halophilus TaxID=571933 RepID=A0A1H9BRH3_9BACI|nr:shikimate dehydrogenase [Piscibacillus halophilus]SEP91301.1 shikimate dehydrogenase [Piscibacillus halophilus]
MYHFGLVGHPVNHSQSPSIHQEFLKFINVEGTYELYDVKEDELEALIRDLKRSGIDGFNVTVPYKEKVIPYLDHLDEQAKKLKSVNTIKRNGNQLIGYNTDGVGFCESLKQASPSFYEQLNKKSVLLLGAGGAAKGIYYSLQTRDPLRLDVANRTQLKAQEITSSYTNSCSLTLQEAERYLNQYDLVIQTTTVGMVPNESEQIISLHNLAKDTIVCDIVYKPMWTRFLVDGQKQGGQLLFGEEMLWHQAAKAFKIWTGYSVEKSIKTNIEGRA